jgi:hypothetical protein
VRLRPLAVSTLAAAFLVVPSVASGYTYDPPPWFKDGVALIKARGGTCQTAGYTDQTPPNPLPGEPTEITVQKSEDCNHRIPRVTAEAIGYKGIPSPKEGCGGVASDVTGQPRPGITPTPERYEYICVVYANPGTNAKPNRRSWICRRWKSGGEGQRLRDDRHWTADRTKLYRKQTFKTLKRCLSRRLRA